MRPLGIHHITSIVGHPQEDIDVNAGILGQRLLKQTLNYDDPSALHLYYGNRTGTAGVTTTFPLTDEEDGEVGGGQVSRIHYGIRPGHRPFWADRLAHYRLTATPEPLLDTELLAFTDPTGLRLGLVETPQGPEPDWAFAGVGGDDALIGLHSATLRSEDPEATLDLLTRILGYTVDAEDDTLIRLKVHSGLGGTLYLERTPAPRGTMGKGTVHHIALAIPDGSGEAWRTHLRSHGVYPTEIRDRTYFQSIYFREAGGILFELATQGPGFTVDEPEETLGQQLRIPPAFEADADRIRAQTMPLTVRPIDALGSYGYRTRDEYATWARRNELRERINALAKRRADHGLTDEETRTLERLRRAFIQTP